MKRPLHSLARVLAPRLVGARVEACTADFSYCQRTPNDARAPGEPAEYTSCQQLPMVCMGKSDCACFPTSTPCIQFNLCKAIDVGSGKTGFQITCPGG